MPFSLHHCPCRSDLLNFSTVPLLGKGGVQYSFFVYFWVKNNAVYTISSAVI